MNEYNLRITKADNGWVIANYDGRNGSLPIGTMVVTDDQELAGMIAAALVSQRLLGEAPKSKWPEEVKYTGAAALANAQMNAQTKAMMASANIACAPHIGVLDQYRNASQQNNAWTTRDTAMENYPADKDVAPKRSALKRFVKRVFA